MTTLARRAAGHGGTIARHALCFRLGDTRLALPADQVATVAEVASCTWIPSADAALLGVARVGRGFLPLVDAHRRLGLAGRSHGAFPPFPWTCVVVKGALGEVAFCIDELLGLCAVPDGSLPSGCVLMPLERLIDGGPDVAGGE